MKSEATEEPEAEVELASRSDIGQVRQANEDSCDIFVREDGTTLLVVADGMGGHRGGATASRTAVETIGELFVSESSGRFAERLGGAIEIANTRIFELARTDPDLEGMGTTLVVFLMDERRRGTVAHVGDSRAYRYRQGRLEALTTDHSVVAEMHRRGLISADEAAAHPRRNEILRSVGVLPQVDVEIASVDIAPGDRFVLCSDGLTGMVSDEEIAAVVQAESPDRAVERLIEMANERGGPDNITVQILSIPADASEGDPEATAPVEISEIGIQAIENRRRVRRRNRRLLSGLAIAAVIVGAILVWRGLHPEGSMGPAPSGGPGAAADAIDAADAPRHGIPR
ncbi:MAG TPA: Stp1/IreP family PP2C-type Ser/Thr phosphatase [Deltaproteobacteria bacterium]|nr:Stp1/IreP family PP2C-type Ser/Thr phosphatase [Deltaproteobacteria bacterium]